MQKEIFITTIEDFNNLLTDTKFSEEPYNIEIETKDFYKQLNLIRHDFHPNTKIWFRNCNSLIKIDTNSIIICLNNCRIVEISKDTKICSITKCDTVVIRDNAEITEINRSTIRAYDNSVIKKMNRCEAYLFNKALVLGATSSKIGARDKTFVFGNNDTRILAGEFSMIISTDNCRVGMRDDAKVYTYDRSTVYYYGGSLFNKSSDVIVYNYSETILSHNTFECKVINMFIDLHGYINKYNIEIYEDKYVYLYKAVHKRIKEDGTIEYFSDYDNDFSYQIGQTITPTAPLNTNILVACGSGIHVATFDWCERYGLEWPDLAILKLRVNLKDIVVPLKTDGKVRASEALIVNEMPLDPIFKFIYDEYHGIKEEEENNA